jgi:alkaline phosphatase D
MISSYQKQSQNTDYQQLKSKIPVIGTWDDHDFGWDNADGNYQSKKASQKHFLDFLEEPELSPRRFREGVHATYDFGSEGRRVKIILLDNRYFKNLDPKYPLLGKVQWEWLESQLQNSTANFHIIVSGLQIFAPQIPLTDEWVDQSIEMYRLLDLIQKYKPKGALFLSGDKHFAAISRRHGQLEFTASGMTHTAPRSTWWFLSKQFEKTFFGLNYGLIDISWIGTNPKIRLTIRGVKGIDVHPTEYKWEKNSWVLEATTLNLSFNRILTEKR